MKSIHLSILIICLGVFINSCTDNVPDSWELKSPDKNISLNLDLKESALSYSVHVLKEYDTIEIIGSSPLGIHRVDGDFSENLSFISATPVKQIDDKYEMIIGATENYHDFANEQSFLFRNESGKKLEIQCRAYNEGVSFRYIFPDTTEGKFIVTGEKTGFNLPDEGKAWMQPYDTIVWWAPAYEQFFLNAIDIGTKAPANRNGWCFPMLFEAKDYFIYVSETGLDTSYVGTHLEDEAPGGLYTIRFPEPEEAYNYFPQNPASSLPWKMPWRYILFSEELDPIFNSQHVYHLSPPQKIENTGWIEPGISSWSWWSDGASPRDYNKLTGFIDFSAEMGWKYSLIDEGWHEMKNGDISQLIEYADTKGVGILLWYDSGGRVGYVEEEQRKIMFDGNKRKAEMKKISDMGVKGIKVDFFQSDKQGMIKLYHDILEDAAKYRLVVNFHGCTLPRGWERKYPNLLTMEAIRGAEAYRFDENYTDYAPVQNTIIPFTRDVAGPVDYTPITLTDNKYPHTTTYAHELALGVIFESGLQHFADHHNKYEELPPMALDYLKKLPAVWNESVLIDGYPGKHVALARRNGKRWFIAGINGEKKEKNFVITTGYLEPGNYTLNLIRDGETRDDLIEETFTVGKDQAIDIMVNQKGGFAGFFEEEK